MIFISQLLKLKKAKFSIPRKLALSWFHTQPSLKILFKFLLFCSTEVKKSVNQKDAKSRSYETPAALDTCTKS